MIRKGLLILLIQLFFQQLFAQNPSASFATWKNNAQGAYSLIHDDFQTWSVAGIQNYADTIAYNRGVKFTFGAITGFVEEQTWTDARRMISHGHEIINHTHTHGCAANASNCAGSIWSSYAIELDQSTNIIYNKTNVYPRFFIWPFDIVTQPSKDYLQGTLHYYGARGGSGEELLNANQLNGPILTDFMGLNFSIYGPTTPISELNGLIDLCISEGKWGIREVHGVNDGSWSSVPLTDYRAHMDYLKAKMQTGQLWVATASEVTTYKMQSQNFIPATTYNATTEEIKISWNNPGIDVSDLRSDVTLNIDLDGLTGYTFIYQNSVLLTDYTVNNGVLTLNIFPHKGDILLRKSRWMDLPPGPFVVSSDRVCTYQQGVHYEVPSIAGATFSWTYSGSGITMNTSSNTAELAFGPLATSGILSVTASNAEGTTPALQMAITVNQGYEIKGDTLCGPGVATLEIMGTGDYEWYNSPVNGSLLNSGITYQPTVTSTTSYYTQVKTVVNNYVLGGNRSFTNFSNTSLLTAQRFTLQKPVVLTTADVNMYGSGTMKMRIISVTSGATVAESAAFSSFSLGTATFNQLLPAGDYYIYIVYPYTGQYYYENAVSSPVTTPSLGSIENKLYFVSVNPTTGALTINNTYNNIFGPIGNLKFTETITGICPRLEVKAIVNNAAPDQPAAFTAGESAICQGMSDYNYSVAADPNALVYNWTYSGTGVTFDGNTNAVLVDYASNAVAGDIEVSASNACGTSSTLALPISFNTPAPDEPVVFTEGETSVCPGTTDLVYTVTSDPDALTYNWTYSSNGVIITGSDNSVLVDYSSTAQSGSIEVSASNTCGTSSALALPIHVIAAPSAPVSFVQSAAVVTQGDQQVAYEIPASTGETYLWTYSGTGAAWVGNDAHIDIDFSTTATSGNLSVKTINVCGVQSEALTMAVTVDLLTSVQSSVLMLQVYPNPATQWVNVEIPSVAQGRVVYVTDMKGVAVMNTKAGNESLLKLDMSSLPAGIYVITIIADEQVYKTKLIKQ